MRPPTLELIEELQRLQWFSQATRSSVPQPIWIVAASKSDAESSALSSDWLNFRLMLSNRMHRDLSLLNYERVSQWNRLAREIQKLATPIIERVSAEWAHGSKVTKEAKISFAWDIQGMCIETEFADQMPPLFFVPRILECYRAGRRPCGWIGPQIDERWAGASNDPLPAGKLLVF
jgi:hypothetical protein